MYQLTESLAVVAPDPAVEVADPSAEVVEPGLAMASRFCRRSCVPVCSGWKNWALYPMVNMQSHMKPFFKALVRVCEGLKIEYESHVITMYALICDAAIAENGRYTVLNLHASTAVRGESLKVLSQSIKDHYERGGALAANGTIPDVLHFHYEIYANDNLDGTCRRLKT